MTIEDIIGNESKNTEFKEMLPKNSEKYVKTIIAFANTQGGKVIIGVADESREIVGVDNATLFQQMDQISNAVSDSCQPQIVPDIEPYTIDGKTVIIITVSPAPHRPYYLKSKGKEKGTYIRVGGTTRCASSEKIKELEMEGSRISWDELPCVGFPVTEKAIKKLCQDINRYRKEMRKDKQRAGKQLSVTRVNLENWSVLKKSGDSYIASNAFALLTSSHFRYARTQCAVFAGKDRGVFIDKQEYAGPIYEQIQSAYAFVLRNIRHSAKVEGLIRQESVELPPNAIREMIINAHCHRNYLDDACVQVSLFDDRLEVTSPGGLCYGLTLDEALSGRSRQRNRVIAEVFNQMGLIEAWGNGLRSICNEAQSYGLPEPEFVEMPDTFRVNLFRKPSDTSTKTDTKTDTENRTETGINTENNTETDINTENCTETDISDRILQLIESEPTITLSKLAKRIKTTVGRIRGALDKLRENGFVQHEGAQKNGRWVILTTQSTDSAKGKKRRQ